MSLDSWFKSAVLEILQKREKKKKKKKNKKENSPNEGSFWHKLGGKQALASHVLRVEDGNSDHCFFQNNTKQRKRKIKPVVPKSQGALAMKDQFENTFQSIEKRTLPPLKQF
jgi:hypothetical protein